MVFKKAFKYSINAIKKHKLLAILLFFLQLLFIALLVGVNMKYQPAIAQNVQNIVQPIQSANFDEGAIREGVPFLSGFADVLENYSALQKNLQKLIGWQLAVFLTIGTLLWAVTHNLLTKQNVVKLWAQLILRAIVFLVPVVIIDYFVLGRVLNSGSFTSMYVAVAITAIAWYFMTICLALPMKSLKKSINEAFELGVMKIHYVVAALVINAMVIGVLMYLVFLSVNWAFWLMVAFIVLLVLSFLAARIFFVAVIGLTNRKIYK